MKDKLFTSFISRQTYQAEWTQVSPSIGDDDTRPGMRGGHQMCIDPDAGIMSYSVKRYKLAGIIGCCDLLNLEIRRYRSANIQCRLF